MSRILHITKREQWDPAKRAGIYHPESLDKEGFIHCSTPEQVVDTANRLFRARPGLVLLVIEPSKVQPEIRYEEGEPGGEAYPHIYGPLNTNAIVYVLPFEPEPDGTFSLPAPLHL